MTAAASDRLPVLLSPGPSDGAGSFGGRFAAPVTYLVFGLLDIFVFGLHAKGDVTFSFTPQFAKVTVPNLTLAAAATCYVCGALTLALAATRLLDVLGTVRLGRVPRRVVIGAVLFLFVVALLAWAGGGQSIPVGVVNLLAGTLNVSIPIMLGALTAVVCSTSGVINIAIEGQLLLGAFCAAIATSVTGSLWLGVVCGAAAGSLVAALLAAFAIAYRVDQIVLGVVLNALVLGLTGYLYNAIMVPYGDTLNNPNTFNPVKIPLLGDIPDPRARLLRTWRRSPVRAVPARFIGCVGADPAADVLCARAGQPWRRRAGAAARADRDDRRARRRRRRAHHVPRPRGRRRADRGAGLLA